MRSSNPKLYWLTLVIMIAALCGTAATAKAKEPINTSPSSEEIAEAFAIVMAPELPYEFAGTMQVESIKAAGSLVIMDVWIEHDFTSFNKSFQQQGITIPAMKKAFDALSTAYVCENPALSKLIEQGLVFNFQFILTDGLIWIVSIDKCGGAS